MGRDYSTHDRMENASKILETLKEDITWGETNVYERNILNYFLVY
jgi:hypothetical protein